MRIINYLLITIIIFFSYNYFQPNESGVRAVHSDEYHLTIHEVNSENKWSEFHYHGNGHYSIHPGEKKAVRAVFHFDTDMNIFLNFSIQKPQGEIEFTIKQNQKFIKSRVIKDKETRQLILNIKSGDNIEIIADKYGDTSYDWGSLKITTPQTSLLYNEILIPLLWIIFFIFLIHKNYPYLAINSSIIFISILFAEKLNFSLLSLNSIFNYTLLIFLITWILIFIHQKLKIATILISFISLILYSLPLIFILYALNFETSITKEILYALFQSNADESYEYISDFIQPQYIFMIVVTILASFTLIYLQKNDRTKKIHPLLLLSLISVTLFSISYKELPELNLPKFIIENLSKYNKEIKRFRKIQKKRKTGEIEFNATKKAKGETYIVVIGESLNKKHMGLYGYFRETTPELSKMHHDGELIRFDNIYSSHTHTMPVLSLALTEANQYNEKTYYESLSILDILNKANIETYWLTNQTIYGGWDNMVSVIATTAEQVVSINSSIGYIADAKKYDGVLIDKVKKILLKKSDKNRVIFVHLMGNHSTYALRYPKEDYSVYSGKLKISEFGKNISDEPELNHYDNSVLYNDYVVSSILKELKIAKGVNGFIYMPDHADDVIRDLGHSIDRFTFEMTQVPMVAWFSEQYRVKYRKKYNTLLTHQTSLYSNDMFYDTLIGLFDIQTENYNAQYDFSSNNYQLEDKKALLVHGEKQYNDSTNHIYWQKQNIKYLLESNQALRIFPHSAISLAKRREIWFDGFRKAKENLPSSYSIATKKSINSTLLAKEIKDKNIQALNFKSSMYKFIKDELEEKISKDIVYFVHSDLSLKDMHFKRKLLKDKIYLDPRVEILLVDYESQFD